MGLVHRNNTRYIFLFFHKKSRKLSTLNHYLWVRWNQIVRWANAYWMSTLCLNKARSHYYYPGGHLSWPQLKHIKMKSFSLWCYLRWGLGICIVNYLFLRNLPQPYNIIHIFSHIKKIHVLSTFVNEYICATHTFTYLKPPFFFEFW